jgi:Flp pilus assembly pilin Flp
MNVIKNFFIDETGLKLSEYALAAGLVALALVVTFANLGRVIELVISALSGNIGTSGIGIE